MEFDGILGDSQVKRYPLTEVDLFEIEIRGQEFGIDVELGFSVLKESALSADLRDGFRLYRQNLKDEIRAMEETKREERLAAYAANVENEERISFEENEIPLAGWYRLMADIKSAT